jgi:CubicO group peptidase (beta-lactamase class C family)
MNNRETTNDFTRSQVGALVSMGLVALWSISVLWQHLSEPVELDDMGALFLFTVVAASLALLPLYALRIRWGYLAGVLLSFWILAGAVLTMVQRNYFFSFSTYNLVVIFIYLVVLAGISLSVQSYRQRPPTPRYHTLAGIGFFVLFTVLVGYAVQTNFSAIAEYRAVRIQERIFRQVEALDTLDEKIAFLVDKGGLPSLTAGIVVNDQLVWANAFGEADLGTAYNVGSVTKMFTATAVMQLIEQGRVGLDDDISRHLPFAVRHPDYPDQPVTIRMLLSHQSGLGSLTIRQEQYSKPDAAAWLAQFSGEGHEPIDPRPPLGDYLAGFMDPTSSHYVEGVWSPSRPGSQHIYANTNYLLLNLLIETVSGQPYLKYMQAQVFTPLEMSDTGFDPAGLGSRMATGYERKFSPLARTNLAVPTFQHVPGPGGLITTAPDLSRFLIAHLNEGQVGGQQLLAPETIALMHAKETEGGGHLNKVGYGLGVTHLAEEPWQYYGRLYDMHGAMGHEGGQIGYSGALYFVEEAKGRYGFVLLTNESFITSEVDFAWYFPILYQINTLLMEEAAARFNVQR